MASTMSQLEAAWNAESYCKAERWYKSAFSKRDRKWKGVIYNHRHHMYDYERKVSRMPKTAKRIMAIESAAVRRRLEVMIMEQAK